MEPSIHDVSFQSQGGASARATAVIDVVAYDPGWPNAATGTNGLRGAGCGGVIVCMATELSIPDPSELDDVVGTLRSWQRDEAPIQLHPGDLGWHWRFGADELASTVRTWSRNGEICAIGFLDGPDVLRMTVAPEVWLDDELAHDVVTDLSAPERGVLPAGKVSVEVPDSTRIQDLLSEYAWTAGDPWTPLHLGLTGRVAQTDPRIEVVDSAEQVSECTAVHRSAWGSEGFTDEKWYAMADGSPFAEARCLLGRDDQGIAVATVTVWAAGPGRPGLLEPLGVHANHRRRGYGAAICMAAAAALRELGSSSALVCTPSSLQSAVRTYEAAGFETRSERLDRTRDATTKPLLP